MNIVKNNVLVMSFFKGDIFAYKALQKIMSLIVMALLVFPSFALSEVLYVSTKTTKLYSAATFSAPVELTLLKASELNVISRNGQWIEVKYLSTTGWVLRYVVSKRKPIANKISILSRLKNLFRFDGGRNRVSVVSTSGGIRGLAGGDVESTGKQDLVALELLESIEVDEQELERFIESNQP